MLGLIVIVGPILLLVLPLSLSTEPVNIRKHTEVYGLTDNHIYPFKGDFCQDLRATSTNVPNLNEPTAYLSFLSTRPPLTDFENFTFFDSAPLDSEINYRNWNFVLNAGSNSSFVACYNSDETRYEVIFNLIRGVSNFKKWVEDVETGHTIQSFRLDERCRTFTYNVTIDANYYFVFYLPSSRRTSLDISFEFDRTLYNLSPDLVVKNCSFPLDGESSCSLGIPYSSGYVTLVSFETTLPVDYRDGANIHFTCTPRGWLYAVIVLVVLFVYVIIGISVLICIVVLTLKQQQGSRKSTTKYKIYAPSSKAGYAPSSKAGYAPSSIASYTPTVSTVGWAQTTSV